MERGAILEWLSTGKPDDRVTQCGETLLHIAAANDHCAMMRVLLAHGASVDATDYQGKTPLHVAAAFSRYGAAALLLDRGADVEARALCATPLICAAHFGGCRMIRLLLHRGADLDSCNEHGEDSWDVARDRENPKAAALLADVRNAGGWRLYAQCPRRNLLALRGLCEQGRVETSDALLRCLFPAGPVTVGRKYRARIEIPRGVFVLIISFWRSDRDF